MRKTDIARKRKTARQARRHSRMHRIICNRVIRIVREDLRMLYQDRRCCRPTRREALLESRGMW